MKKKGGGKSGMRPAVGIEPSSSAGKTCTAARAAEATLGAPAKPLQQTGLAADYG
jgi:hypothetical protein